MNKKRSYMNIRFLQKISFAHVFGWVVLLIMISDAVSSQETGNPFILNLNADSYNAHAQNFAVEQDSRGVLYFGNFAGILEYDGESWRIIPTENITKVSSLSDGPDGRIYVGARGEIGYLSPDDI
jgi:hypothetical protein